MKHEAWVNAFHKWKAFKEKKIMNNKTKIANKIMFLIYIFYILFYNFNFAPYNKFSLQFLKIEILYFVLNQFI